MSAEYEDIAGAMHVLERALNRAGLGKPRAIILRNNSDSDRLAEVMGSKPHITLDANAALRPEWIVEIGAVPFLRPRVTTPK